ncbi:MAG: HEAT repeat domain-containing protein [Elusimicrobiota bacterium]|jgi:hypothetical protein
MERLEFFSRPKRAAIWGVLGAVGAAIVFFLSILKSHSSTAGIGIFFIPFMAVPFFIPFYVFGYCAPDLLAYLRRKNQHLPIAQRIRAGIAALMITFGGAYVIYGTTMTWEVIRARNMAEQDLSAFLDHSFFRNNKFVLGAVAQNPHASAQILDRIAKMPGCALSDKMWSSWPVMGSNGKGLAVVRLVVLHNNVAPQTLEYLSYSQNEYVLGTVAQNSRTPVEALRRLSGIGGYLIEWGLAYNQSTPNDILTGLASSRDKYTRATIASNPSTPVDTLVRLAHDTDAWVRRAVAGNRRSPAAIAIELCNDADDSVRSMAKYMVLDRRIAGH